MDDIPDHAIQSPFGTTSRQMKTQHDRFEKYKKYIIPVFKKIYDERLGCKSGFECPICGSWLGGSRSYRLLAHLSSVKCLMAAGVLEECDQRNRRGLGRKHTKDSTATPVDTVVGQVACGLGE